MIRSLGAAIGLLALASAGAWARSSALAELRAQAGPTAPAPAETSAISAADALSQSMSDDEKSYRFTADDYMRLKARGGALRPAAGSDWVPAAVQDDVLAAIDYAFAKGMADELSWKDFFHGHVELDPGAAVSPDLGLLALERERFSRVCDATSRYAEYRRLPAAASPQTFADALYGSAPCDPGSLTQSYKDLLAAFIANPGWHILFHTRELTHEQLDPAQAKRTIVARPGRALAAVPFMRAGETDSSETSAGSIQIFFFAKPDGEVVFYPSEDIFLLQRGWFHDRGLTAPF